VQEIHLTEQWRQGTAVKKYIKNFLLLFIFMSLNGAIELAPKKYTQYQTKAYLKENPAIFVGLPLLTGDVGKYLTDGPPEAKEFMKNYMDSYKKIVWASAVAKWVLLAIFTWVFTRFNRQKSSIVETHECRSNAKVHE